MPMRCLVIFDQVSRLHERGAGNRGEQCMQACHMCENPANSARLATQLAGSVQWLQGVCHGCHAHCTMHIDGELAVHVCRVAQHM